MKNKMTDKQKAILIYSGEFILFAIIFLVLGTLKITQVMPYKEGRRIVFNWITLFAAIWPIADFIWALASKRRRQRICLLDKILTLPLPIFMIVFDLISLISKPENTFFYVASIAAAFYYVAVLYLVLGIYHYFKPIPELVKGYDENGNEIKEPEDDKKEKQGE